MDKEKQKQAITEIMNDDAKDGLYKQQTVVQWLYHKLQSECLIDMADDIFEQAKQMHRDEIETAYINGKINAIDILDGCSESKSPSNYYTQTYGQ